METWLVLLSLILPACSLSSCPLAHLAQATHLPYPLAIRWTTHEQVALTAGPLPLPPTRIWHVLFGQFQDRADVFYCDCREQGAVGTATSEGGCGCAKRCGCEEKREEEENYYSDNPWEGIIGREEFLDALGAGPNAVGRVCVWPVASFPAAGK